MYITNWIEIIIRHKQSSYFWEFSGDDRNKLLVAYSSISVSVGEINHLVNFGGREVLSNAGGHLLEVLGSEAAGAPGVEEFIELLEGGFGLAVAESEDFQEEGEIDLFGGGVVGNDVEDLFGLLVEAEGSDGVDEFIGRDVSTVIVVEDVEALLQFGDVFLLEVLAGVFLWIKSLNHKSLTLLITRRYAYTIKYKINSWVRDNLNIII